MRHKLPKVILLGLLAVLVGAGIRSLTAEQRSRDGVWQAVPSSEKLGSWAPASAPAPTFSPTPPSQRKAPFEHGKRLSDYARPGEAEVDVEKHNVPPFLDFGGDSADDELRALTQTSDAAAILRVVSVTSSPTFDDQWIKSSVVAVVEQVLKRGEGLAGLAVGDRLEFNVDGGVLAVGGVTVRAKAMSVRLPEPGRAYLYFFGVDPITFVPPDTRLRVPRLVPFDPGHTFEIDGDVVKRLRTDVKGALDDAPGADSVVAKVRNFSSKK